MAKKRRKSSKPGSTTVAQRAGLVVLAVVAVALAVAALGSPGQVPPPSNIRATASPSPTPEVVVHQAVMLGDSYFNGWGKVSQADAIGNQTALALGYTPLLRGTGATGYVARRSSERAGGAAGNFIEGLAADPLTKYNAIELVVINGGLADRSIDAGQFDAGMRGLIAEVRRQAPGARVVVLGPPNVTPQVEASGMDARQRAIASEVGVDYISFDDVMPASELRPQIDADDLTHPQSQAVSVIVDRLVQRLQDIGVADYSTP